MLSSKIIRMIAVGLMMMMMIIKEPWWRMTPYEWNNRGRFWWVKRWLWGLRSSRRWICHVGHLGCNAVWTRRWVNFSPEDRGTTFFRNIDTNPKYFTALQLEDHHLYRSVSAFYDSTNSYTSSSVSYLWFRPHGLFGSIVHRILGLPGFRLPVCWYSHAIVGRRD
jgi:hypothetical protein